MPYNFNKINNRYFYWGVLLFFTSIFLLTSLVNHYFFRTNALDMGVYNHLIYQISHFKSIHYMVGNGGGIHDGFAGHFAPIMYLYMPFYWLMGTYGLLVLQVLSVLAGGVGIYKYAQFKGLDKKGLVSLLVLIQFFSIWGIYSALSCDFHNNVIAAMMVPWFMINYEKGKIKWAVLFFILILICKENMALWMIFVMLGLMLKHRKKGLKLFKFELPLLALACAYFIIVFSLIMPELGKTFNLKGNHQLDLYLHIGNSVSDIIYNLITDPTNTFSLLFENTRPESSFDGIKAELHFIILVSGGLALIYKPHYLVMLIPIYAQKLFSTNYGLWGINYQYSIEFVPILSLALIETLASIKRYKLQLGLILIVLGSTIYFSISKINHRKSLWYNKTNTAFYLKNHYNSEQNLPIGKINKALKMIPNNAIVSATSALIPHICKREKIYQFPNINDANYIVILLNENAYPITPKELNNKLLLLKKDSNYIMVYDQDKLLIFKKTNLK